MVWQKGTESMKSRESACPEDWWREVDPLANPEEDAWCFIANQICDASILLNKLKKKNIQSVDIESSRAPLFAPAVDQGKNRTAKHLVTLTVLTPRGYEKQKFPVYQLTEEEKVIIYYNLASRLHKKVERLWPGKELSADDLKDWGEYQTAISQLSNAVEKWERGGKRDAGKVKAQEMRALAQIWYAHCYVFYMDGLQKGYARKTRTTFNSWFEKRMLSFKKQRAMGIFLIGKRFDGFFNLLFKTKSIPNFDAVEYEIRRYLGDKGLSDTELRLLVKKNPQLSSPLPSSVSEIIFK